MLDQPVFVPHIRGGDLPPGTVTPKESVSQFPCLVAEPTADAPFAPTGPIVTVVAVTCGITATNKAAMQDHLLPGHSEQMSQSPAWADKHQSCTCTQWGSRRCLWSGRSWWSRCSSLKINDDKEAKKCCLTSNAPSTTTLLEHAADSKTTGTGATSAAPIKYKKLYVEYKQL